MSGRALQALGESASRRSDAVPRSKTRANAGVTVSATSIDARTGQAIRDDQRLEERAGHALSMKRRE
jgi:hypothetical protein